MVEGIRYTGKVMVSTDAVSLPQQGDIIAVRTKGTQRKEHIIQIRDTTRRETTGKPVAVRDKKNTTSEQLGTQQHNDNAKLVSGHDTYCQQASETGSARARDGGDGNGKDGPPTLNDDSGNEEDFGEGKMRTVTIRLDDEIMELVEAIAKFQNRKKSDILRDGIIHGMYIEGGKDPRVREIQERIAQRQIERRLNIIRRNLGMEGNITKD